MEIGGLREATPLTRLPVGVTCVEKDSEGRMSSKSSIFVSGGICSRPISESGLSMGTAIMGRTEKLS